MRKREILRKRERQRQRERELKRERGNKSCGHNRLSQTFSKVASVLFVCEASSSRMKYMCTTFLSIETRHWKTESALQMKC